MFLHQHSGSVLHRIQVLITEKRAKATPSSHPSYHNRVLSDFLQQPDLKEKYGSMARIDHNPNCWNELKKSSFSLKRKNKELIERNWPAVTKRRLYCMRLWARPLGFFFLSCLATFGVWPLTFPARASDPCTLPESNQNRNQSIT